MVIATVSVQDAPTIWKLLKGIICVYKPIGLSEGGVRHSLLKKLCNELNTMECRPPGNYVAIEGDTTKEMRVTVRTNYADHPLVVGPRYQEKDFKCDWVLPLGKNTSGVFLLGLNEGISKVSQLDRAHHLRTFHVDGCFGRKTATFFTDGMVVERSKFDHVSQHWLNNYLHSVQAGHQRSMFELAGLDMQSQDAYELVKKGLPRPADPHIPMIYGIKCIDFQVPKFTIEVQCTNEYEFYLMSLINEIGIKLRTTAVCTGIRCVRHGYFTVDNALLRKHWTLQHTIKNLQDNQRILDNNPNVFSSVLQKVNIYNPKDKSQ